jgi:hypothetical protein
MLETNKNAISNDQIPLSSEATNIYKVVSILVCVILWGLALLGFASFNDFALFIIPIIYLAYIILRVIPQKTIYYNNTEIAIKFKDKLERISFSEVTSIERKSLIGFIFEIKTKQKRRIFDRLFFTPRFIDILKCNGFGRPEHIKNLEKLINEMND